MRKLIGFIVMSVLFSGCALKAVEYPALPEPTAAVDSAETVTTGSEPVRFYISLTFVDDETKEPVTADVTLLVDDDGDGDPKTGTQLEPPCIQVTGCEFSVPVDGLMYVYAIEADGYETHSLGVRPHYDTEKRLHGEVPLTRIVVPDNARSG